MKKISMLVFVGALALTGCTTVKTIDLREATSTWQPALYTITLNDGSEFDVLDAQVKDDSIFWVNPGTGEKAGAATTQVKTISCEVSALQARMMAPAAFSPMVCSQLPSAATTPAFAEINKLAHKKRATVTLADNRTEVVYSLHAAPDYTSWRQRGQWQTIPTADIREIQFDRSDRGALAGTLSGVLTGVIVGIILAQTDDEVQTERVIDRCVAREPVCSFGPFSFTELCPCTKWSFRDERTGGANAGSWLLTTPLGGLIGFLIGKAAAKEEEAKDIYRFEVPVPSSRFVQEKPGTWNPKL